MNGKNEFDVHKNASATIRIAKRNYRGRKFIDIREFYRDIDGELQPSPKGVTLLPDPEKIQTLIDALLEIKNQLCKDNVGGDE